MSLTFRLATIADAAIVARLIDAMDTHYRPGDTAGLEPAVAMVEDAIRRHEGTQFLLAFAGADPAGLACFAVLRPGYRHQGLLFLKDLFVPELFRGRRIGRAMMAELAAFAIAHAIGRIDLTTDTTNIAARSLYESLGGDPQDKVMFRFDGEALRALARHGR